MIRNNLKSITQPLIPPNVGALSESYLNPFGRAVTPVKSFCAKGDGATGYIDYGVRGLCASGKSSFELECYIKTKPTVALSAIACEDKIPANRGWAIAYESETDKINFLFGNDSGGFKATVSLTGVGLVDGCTLKVTAETSGANMTVKSFINGLETKSGTLSGQTKIYSNGGKLILFRMNDGAGAAGYTASDGAFCNVKVKVGSSYVFTPPLAGSTIDTTNGWVGTITGTVDLFQKQDSFHYNLNNGFDLYFRTGGDADTQSDYRYVPYVAGVPVVASLTGYTKQSSHPASSYKNGRLLWHNGCETALRMPAGSLMDKSDTDEWLDTLRALDGYDAVNPTDWHNNTAIAELQELRQGFIQTHWDDAKNRIFVGNNPLDYTGDIDTDILETDDTENSLKAQSLIIYSKARTVRQLREIYRYFRRLMK